MNLALPLAGLLLFLAIGLLWLAARQRRASGLPAGRVVAADMGSWRRLEKPLYDPATGLAGKPDYILEQNGAFIPVEVKSTWAPAQPYDGHLFQLAAYCLLLERNGRPRPPYGILHYRNRTFAIDYTAVLEEHLLNLLDAIHTQQRHGEADRSHEQPTRCARCGYRQACDQRLS
jgi:CRISPR-associated exonuclease Cas4